MLLETVEVMNSRERELLDRIAGLEHEYAAEAENLKESHAKHEKEIQRLRTHLIEIEGFHGQEVLDLENTIALLKTELAESSRGQSTWEDILSTERELASQAVKAKEAVEEELNRLLLSNQELVLKNKELVLSMDNLQRVLQNFEKCKYFIEVFLCFLG